MPVWKSLCACCLGVLTLLPVDGARAETALAALDWGRPAFGPLERDLECLALNIYWEARSEALLGQVAVAAVTLNRVAAPAFPDNVCDVVFQGEERGRHLCQFSWRCDGRGDRPRNLIAWHEARRVARLALNHQVSDPTGGALWYHADHVRPAWAQEMTMRARIGHHLFYGRGPSVGVLARLQPDAGARAAAARLASIPPPPKKPAPTITLAAASPATAALATQLRIDFGHQPADELLFCANQTLCGELAPVQALDETNSAPPFFDAQRPADPELGAKIADATHAPAEATVDRDRLSLVLLDGAIERSAARTAGDELAGGTVQALATTASKVRLAALIWPGDRQAAFTSHALRATSYLASGSGPTQGLSAALELPSVSPDGDPEGPTPSHVAGAGSRPFGEIGSASG